MFAHRNFYLLFFSKSEISLRAAKEPNWYHPDFVFLLISYSNVQLLRQMLSTWIIFKTSFFSSDLYAFAVPENAAVGSTVGRIMAQDGDIGINARMTYSLEDDLEESSTFIIKTDPVTQEGVVLLAKVNKHIFIFSIWILYAFFFNLHLVFSLMFQRK